MRKKKRISEEVMPTVFKNIDELKIALENKEPHLSIMLFLHVAKYPRYGDIFRFVKKLPDMKDSTIQSALRTLINIGYVAKVSEHDDIPPGYFSNIAIGDLSGIRDNPVVAYYTKNQEDEGSTDTSFLEPQTNEQMLGALMVTDAALSVLIKVYASRDAKISATCLECKELLAKQIQKDVRKKKVKIR